MELQLSGYDPSSTRLTRQTVKIDDQLGGKATQHREVQDYESQQFLSLFSPGIQILKGGIDSAFNKVDRDAHRTRLLKVKGTKNVRVTEVLAEPLSLNRFVRPARYIFTLVVAMFLYSTQRMLFSFGSAAPPASLNAEREES